MARPSKTATIDYTAAHDLTHGLLDRAACPDGAAFVLLRDSEKKGLRLRVTKAGGKHWQFEARIKGRLFTRALGEWPAVGLDVARKEAHRLRGLTEQGIDPREGEALEKAAKEQAKAENERAAKFTFGALMVAFFKWGEGLTWIFKNQIGQNQNRREIFAHGKHLIFCLLDVLCTTKPPGK
jgi:Arm DNA-binding domain